MQEKSVCTSVLQARFTATPGLRHPAPAPTNDVGPLRRSAYVFGATLLALLMTMGLSVNAYAKSAPLKATGGPALLAPQQANLAVEENAGLVIIATDREGPAAAAGIVRGDILLRVDEVAIDSASALYELVTTSEPGDEVLLVVLHGDETRTIPVTLSQKGDRAYLGVQVAGGAEAETEAEVAIAIPEPVEIAPATTEDVVTATVVITNDAVPAANADTITFGPGLTVAQVVEGGPAAVAGIVAGDMIIAIDGKPVVLPEDLINGLKGHTPAERAILLIQRSGPNGVDVTHVPVILGAAPDDPSRAYLGIQVISMSPRTVIDAPSPDGPFTAPAVPVLPEPQVAPDMLYSYPPVYAAPSYAVPTYAAPLLPQSCTPIIQQFFFSGGTPVSAPLPPAQSALPAMPGSAVLIYQSGINPEVYPYTIAREVSAPSEGDVIFYRAEPGQPAEVMTPGVPVQRDVTIIRSPQAMWTMAAPFTVQSQDVMQESGTATLVPVPPVLPQAVPAVDVQEGWY